jgi:transposase-like protein
MSRLEVFTGRERRRRWSAEEERSIVAEAFAPGGVGLCGRAAAGFGSHAMIVSGHDAAPRPRLPGPRQWVTGCRSDGVSETDGLASAADAPLQRSELANSARSTVRCASILAAVCLSKRD